ncbi:MAG: tetratricopeptide repeat protein [Smithellaceae bacterium]|nr:tetratricopeptide repeat protein [Smithellaceae bacterium]
MKTRSLLLSLFSLFILGQARTSLGVTWGALDGTPPLVIAQSAGMAQRESSLREAIDQYRKENYEEAIEMLLLLRKQDPSSSMAAFFLGMAYKQTQDFPQAATNLEAAATFRPPVRESLVELIDVLFQLNRLSEARKWIDLAQREGISPSRVAFLSGLVFGKENRNQEAVASFEKAKTLEPALAAAADFQIAIAHVKERKLPQARERLRAVIQQDTLSDLAGFARSYLAAVEDAIHQERPLRLTLGFIGSYDTNMVQKPLESAVAGGITNERGYVLNSSARLDYVPRLPGGWLFQGTYSFASALHSKNTHSHDSMANSFAVTPGYNFGRMSLSLLASYTGALLRVDPDLVPAPDSSPGYKSYLDYTTVGPIFRYMVDSSNLLELFAGYDRKDYRNQKIATPEGDRDSEGFRAYLSWVWLFREQAFMNLRYEYTQERASGVWWQNQGNRFSVNLSYPLMAGEAVKKSGQLNLQAGGSAFFQDYQHEQPYLDKDGTTIRSTARQDRVYAGQLGLSYALSRYATAILQYVQTKSDSNIPANEYVREQYMAGMEFRF